MKKYWILRGIKMFFFAVLAVGLFGFVVMHLWNWLMPSLFGLGTITFFKALGILVLSKILFGGFGGHGGRGCHGGKDKWKRQMQQKFHQMTPEERKAFKARFSKHRGCWGEDVTEEKSDDSTTEQ